MVSPEEVRDAIKIVEDPEIGLSIVDLGLIYDCEVTESNVKVTMTPPDAMKKDPNLTDAGKYYSTHNHSLDGYKAK